MRIFDVAKADEFYLNFFGFKVDWDHRVDDNAPPCRQISRSGLTLHLSEHHGDGSPGARLRVRMIGIAAFLRELGDKHYRYCGQTLKLPNGIRATAVLDPFGNQARFFEPIEPEPPKRWRDHFWRGLQPRRVTEGDAGLDDVKRS